MCNFFGYGCCHRPSRCCCPPPPPTYNRVIYEPLPTVEGILPNLVYNMNRDWYDLDLQETTDTSNKDIIMRYVFKQQVHYQRHQNNKSLNWIPLEETNGQTFIDEFGASQISSRATSGLGSAEVLDDIPVVFPDYSKVIVGQGKIWPTKVYAPYVDGTAWPPYQIADISEELTNVLYYNLGFIVSRLPTVCEPSWGGFYEPNQYLLNDQIKKLREELGGDVAISFGGAANTPLFITAPDVESLFEQYKRFSVAYGLRRIDFDIEGAFISRVYAPAHTRNSKAIKQLQDYFIAEGSSIDVHFTLPVLPTGLTDDGVALLQNALDNDVDIGGVNIMAMDYGDGAAPDPEGRMGEYAIQAMNSLFNQLNTLYGGSKTPAELWAMIGVCPMIGINDVITEIFDQTNAVEVLDFANSVNAGMITMWSCNRDNSSQSGIPQTDYEFQSIWQPYTN